MSERIKENNLFVESASTYDMDTIYQMGFDAWGENFSMDEYLNVCRNSSKYAQGEWLILKDLENNIYSSLLLHKFSFDTCGIGSIATPLSKRKNGYASMLIKEALVLLAKKNVKYVYLYSDIEPVIYEKLGFISLPLLYQKYLPSICMVNVFDKNLLDFGTISIPNYF